MGQLSQTRAKRTKKRISERRAINHATGMTKSVGVGFFKLQQQERERRKRMMFVTKEDIRNAEKKKEE